jgi:TetR/AcrR family transcriptional repressor of mexJK operon
MIMVREMPHLKQPATAAALKNSAAAKMPLELAGASKMLQLMEAADDIFLAKGYHSATMNDVAKAAGMSKKTVYRLIPSKAELFVALLEHHQKKLVLPAIQEDWTPREILIKNLFALGQFMLAPNQTSIVRLIMAEYTHSNDFGRAFHQRQMMKARTLVENCLLPLLPPAWVKTGDLRETAGMLFGMAIAEFHLSILIGFRHAPSKLVLERRISHAVDMLLAGCESKKPF